MRRILPILVLPVAFLAACSAAGPATTSPATTSPTTTGPTSSAATSPAATTEQVNTATPRCHTADLKVTSAYGDGATGHYSVNLRFTNRSAHTCTLYGYPGVSWVAGDKGTQVNDPFKRETATKKTITIKPGATAHSMLLEEQVAFFDAKTCKPVEVRGYRVYPPDETAAVFVSAPEKACSGKGTGVGEVYPVVTGPGQSAS